MAGSSQQFSVVRDRISVCWDQLWRLQNIICWRNNVQGKIGYFLLTVEKDSSNTRFVLCDQRLQLTKTKTKTEGKQDTDKSFTMCESHCQVVPNCT